MDQCLRKRKRSRHFCGFRGHIRWRNFRRRVPRSPLFGGFRHPRHRSRNAIPRRATPDHKAQAKGQSGNLGGSLPIWGGSYHSRCSIIGGPCLPITHRLLESLQDTSRRHERRLCWLYRRQPSWRNPPSKVLLPPLQRRDRNQPSRMHQRVQLDKRHFSFEQSLRQLDLNHGWRSCRTPCSFNLSC